MRLHYTPKRALLKNRAERRDALTFKGEKLGRRGAPPSVLVAASNPHRKV